MPMSSQSCTTSTFILDNCPGMTATIEGFSNLDWGRDPDTRRSDSG